MKDSYVVLLDAKGPEINLPAQFEPGPFLENQHVFLDAKGPEINPPAQFEPGPG